MYKPNTYSLLIAEDDAFMANAIQHILSEFKINFKIVSSGNEVLDEYQNDYYNMVLMDIMLPGMDGFETAKSLRNSNKFIPIIAFTVLNYEDIKSKISMSGINHYIKKPTNSKDLQNLLKDYFSVAA